jgi:hypothetical protein
MSDFSVFMAGNAVKDETVKYVASKRFLDAKKKPVEWELKSISSDLDEALRKDCTKKVPIPGKRGQYNQETDTDKYIGKLCVACTVYPDLNNAELQDSYGVKGAEALLKTMLKPGEYTEYKAKVMEVNGYDMSMEELVDEAKN